MKTDRPDLTFITQAKILDINLTENGKRFIFQTKDNKSFVLSESKEIDGIIENIPKLIQIAEMYNDSLQKDTMLYNMVNQILNSIKIPNMLSTENNIFQIKFIGNKNGYIFNGSENEKLGNLINEYSKHGIEFIKKYENSNHRFMCCSKKEIEMYFGWDTYSYEKLKSVNFIK